MMMLPMKTDISKYNVHAVQTPSVHHVSNKYFFKNR